MGRSGVAARASVMARIGVIAGGCLVLAHCGKGPGGIDPKYGVAASPRVVQPGEPVPKGGGAYRVGKPYVVAGRTYVPQENPRYSAEGTASWYGEDFHGRLTANGEVYDIDAISAAHPTLPIPSYARITNLENKRSIVVRVNDRGPYHPGRLIDVSVRTAKLLGFYGKGSARVRVDYAGRASLEGSDDSKLEATLRRDTPAPGHLETRLASKAAPRNDGAGGSPRPAAIVAHEPPAAGMTALSQRAATEPSATFAGRFAPVANAQAAPARTGAVSAFAPAAADYKGSVVTGRGLY
jgi:rare lipoprotein A